MIKGPYGYYKREPLTISSVFQVKFGVNRHCVSGDLIGLVCHLISQGNVIKVLCDFMGGSSLW